LPRVPLAMLATSRGFQVSRVPAALKAARTILIAFHRVKESNLRHKRLI
jgi:hypothetical protein